MVLRRFINPYLRASRFSNCPFGLRPNLGRAASAEMATGLFAEDDSPVSRNLAMQGRSGNVREVAGRNSGKGCRTRPDLWLLSP